MRYAVWNNKGGVGKSFLSFILGSEIAIRNPDSHVVLVDMCPQANLSEIVLGGNGNGAGKLQALLGGKHRNTVGGYFDSRISSPSISKGVIMELIKVDSSMIYAFGYDEQQQILEVVFKRTGVYRYHNVPKEVYQQLLDADSKGSYMRDLIIDMYPTERVR